MRRWSNRSVLLLTALVGTFAVPLRGQAPDQKPLAFEVASIKPNTSGDSRGGGRLSPGGRVTFVNESLRAVIRDAYADTGISDVIGGPGWIDTDKWDIAATAPSGQGDAPTRLMMQTLLADRFKLVALLEKRQQPVYTLIMSSSDKKLGPRLHASSTACPITGNSCGTQVMPGQITGIAAEVSDITRTLSRVLGRKVMDRTGLTGRFDFILAWTPDAGSVDSAAAKAADRAAANAGVEGGSLVTALQEQLGLKLESTKAPVDVLVIDRVEKPTPD
jgi:uncharacterized protein (TIGR03435 family)